MNKKSQVIVVTLWILVMLAVLAVNIGQRVSLGLRLCRYQQDSLRALSLAKTGLNLAIRQLLGNKPDDPSVLANTSLKNLLKENEDIAQVLEIADEESKININTANHLMLNALFEECGLALEAEALIHDILIYRGSEPMDEAGKNSGYFFKRADFSSIEEFFSLPIVKEIDNRKQENLKALITVFGDGKININTAGPRVMKILVNAAFAELAASNTAINASAETILAKLIEFRASKTGSISLDDLTKNISSLDTDTDLNNIWNVLTAGFINIESQYFAISVTVSVMDSKPARKIDCVYNRERGKEKIVFWHES